MVAVVVVDIAAGIASLLPEKVLLVTVIRPVFTMHRRQPAVAGEGAAGQLSA